MASNLSSIGFIFKGNDDFAAKMIELAGTLDLHAQCDAGQYAIWREPSGAQLWFHITQDEDDREDERSISGLTPFFEGKSQVKAKITQAIHRSDDNEFEGCFHAWINPDDTGEGLYPVIFDAVDFALHVNRKMPFVAPVRLSAFARELTAFGSKEDYDARQTNEPKLSSQSFIPIGLFAASTDPDAGAADGAAAGAADNTEPAVEPDLNSQNCAPTALITGHVTAHHILQNGETGRDFHWLVIESFNAKFDVVADPDIIKGVIAVGGVVEVACWMFGRLLKP